MPFGHPETHPFTPDPEHCQLCGLTTAAPRHSAEPHLDGARSIWIERVRQIADEGWTAEHDDVDVAGGDLARAASCYILAVVDPDVATEWWPWDDDWWKPSDDPIRNLVKAGALIAAEIDRLQRAKR